MEARDLVARFERVSFEWVPRARNAYADRLANEAMDADAAGKEVRAGYTASDEPAGAQTESDPAEEMAQPALAGSWLGKTSAPTRLLLLRHGQTELSAQKRYSGRGDPELTELGVQQAKAAAARLAAKESPSAIVSSPLRRALRTAEEVGAAVDLSPVVDDGLVELDFGNWEGLTFAEAAERDPQEHRRWLADPTAPIPGGESLEAVQRRVRRVRDDVLARHRGQTVVLVTHVTPIKTLLRMALEASTSLYFRMHLDLASLSIVEFYPDGHSSVRLVNDTSYLD
jgi:probable phosphoglycerate mutase